MEFIDWVDIVVGITLCIAIVLMVIGIIALIKTMKPNSGNMVQYATENSEDADKQMVYLLDANYHVTYLEMDDEEITHAIDVEWEKWISGSEPDMTINGVHYNFKFVMVPEGEELYLIYSRYKDNHEVEEKRVVSGIEILELEKGHELDLSYTGEKKLAEMYCNILDGCQKYLFN